MINPLYDMRSQPAELYDMRSQPAEPIRAVLSVVGRARDRRHSLGVPAWMGTELALASARGRGWNVLGIWRAKAKQ